MTFLHRRQLLRGLAAGGGAALLAGGDFGPVRTGSRAAAHAATPGVGGDYAMEVDAGLAYFQRRAAELTPLVETLATAIAGGDLSVAKSAYVAARPPYEEIEVLAASFPETDAAIDARPYSFDGGETSPDYVSVHRIEALLYRDEDLDAALPFARGLIESARQLELDLVRREAFDVTLHFEGMVALANEIAAKKISSEEETWSDQSLLIFAYNWRGIQSQYEPFAGAVERADVAVAAAVETAYQDALATLSPYPPASDGAFPSYSAVPMSDRRELVRASYAYRNALTQAGAALDIL